VVQVGVEAAAGDQFGVATLFDDPALVDDGDQVGGANG
jgi:hypothetical protein